MVGLVIAGNRDVGLLEQCLAHVQQPLTVPLPAVCRPEPRCCPYRNLGVFLAACLALVGGWAISAEWLSDNEPQRKHSASSETKPRPAPLVQSGDRDPANAWDATAEEIETLDNDLSPFETRAQKLWGDPTQTIEE